MSLSFLDANSSATYRPDNAIFIHGRWINFSGLVPVFVLFGINSIDSTNFLLFRNRVYFQRVQQAEFVHRLISRNVTLFNHVSNNSRIGWFYVSCTSDVSQLGERRRVEQSNRFHGRQEYRQDEVLNIPKLACEMG